MRAQRSAGKSAERITPADSFEDVCVYALKLRSTAVCHNSTAAKQARSNKASRMPPSKPVLITGAATPLGHKVCRTLLAAGRKCVALVSANDTESLTAVELEAAGTRYVLTVGHDRMAIVGRGEGVDARFADDLGMSGRHCVLEHTGTDVVVRDAGSTNGTCVDGAATPQALRVGSVIEAGDTTLRVTAIAPARDRAAAALERRGPVVVTELAAARGCVAAVDCAPPLQTPAAERQRTLAIRAAVGGGPVAAASSSAVYDGACRGFTIVETDFLPRASELTTSWAARENALSDGRTVVVRLFDIYGGNVSCGAAPSGAAASLVRNIVRGVPIDAAYEGDASHVSEAATWLCAALDYTETNDGFVAVNGGSGATVRGPEPDATAATQGLFPLDGASVSRRANITKLRELLGVAGGVLSVSRGVTLCRIEEAAARECVSVPARRATSGHAADRLQSLPDDALTAALVFADGADLARLRSAAKGLIAIADAAAVVSCRAKGFARPDWAASGAPRLLAAGGAWRRPFSVARGRDPFAPRVKHATAAVGGRLYCFGGLGDDGPTNALDVLELSGDRTVARWVPFETMGDKPLALEHAQMAALELLDGRQYLIVATLAAGLYVLDLSSRVWSLRLFSGDFCILAALNIDGRPHVVGVDESYQSFNVIDGEQLVNMVNGDVGWISATNTIADSMAFSPRDGAAAVVVGSTIVVCGGQLLYSLSGQDTTYFLNDAEGFTLHRAFDEYVVEWAPWSLPGGRAIVRRAHHAAVALGDGSILVVGGIENGLSATDAHVLRPGEDPVPFNASGESRPRVAASAARVGDAVVIIGGQGALERRDDVDVLVLPSAG